MTVKVAINGFGRIGRNAFKIAMERADKKFEVVAINDLTDAKTLAHLLKYDSCFGKFDSSVEVKEGAIVVDGKEIKIFAERDPENLPWGELGIDIVVESTGFFREKAKAEKHIKAGAKKVIISAPAKNEDVTVVLGVNEGDYNPETDHVISNASCTTNCLAPFAKIIDENFGIKTGLMTTVHAYTNDQNTLDAPHADLRRARAAAESIIPTTTGAAAAVALVLPQLKGKLNGMAMRVPTPTVSVVDLVVELEKETTAEEINAKLKAAAEGPLKGILGFSEEPLVSIDYRKDSRSSIVDGLSTMVMEGKLAKIVSWYDNEWGYSTRVVDLISYLIERGL
ncbi:type I glyceraldehyde-3-phosphate dehydrogenase [Anaeromicrobium sediminis]|uniref:Glyceraldehyde-3-phosphate dehydrogenase n=1 Tax=Anaeromicrobium sediminis TaxID=1478221 RepID=A0A267MPU0_9FIRM|nr:type I glyceraldehyde-3-phosphate dehydrogenase [Anaeromicrobium sediminis]PAB60803.1 type I glyceraldehyde-3-phosphate dehydrogenase [Anaeromicrobium sediminis]